MHGHGRRNKPSNTQILTEGAKVVDAAASAWVVAGRGKVVEGMAREPTNANEVQGVPGSTLGLAFFFETREILDTWHLETLNPKEKNASPLCINLPRR